MPDVEHAPELIFEGGTDILQLEPGGKEYKPGDVIPRLSHARRVALQATGIRFTTRHHEPVVTPDGKPAAMAAAEQMPEGAVIVAVEAAPAAELPRGAAKERK